MSYWWKYNVVSPLVDSAPTVGAIKTVNEPKTNRTDSRVALSALFEFIYSQPR